MSKRRAVARASARAQRTSAAEREARPPALAASRSPRWRPIAVWAMPRRSHSSSVWAKSRAVTRTSWPSARSRSITGRITSTCGLFVRSIQTRMRDAHGIVAAGNARPRARSPNRSSTIAWHFVRDAGLPAIFVLMVAESACIPIPSEATMLFAGFAVANPGTERRTTI